MEGQLEYRCATSLVDKESESERESEISKL